MPTPNWPQSWQGPARTCVDSRVGPSRPRLTSFFFSFMFTTNRLICRYSTRAQPAAAASNHPHPPLMFTAECGVESVLSMWCLHHLMFHHTGTRGLALAPCYLWQSLLIHCHIATTLPAGQGSVCPVLSDASVMWGCLLPAGHPSTCWPLSTLHIYSR